MERLPDSGVEGARPLDSGGPAAWAALHSRQQLLSNGVLATALPMSIAEMPEEEQRELDDCTQAGDCDGVTGAGGPLAGDSRGLPEQKRRSAGEVEAAVEEDSAALSLPHSAPLHATSSGARRRVADTGSGLVGSGAVPGGTVSGDAVSTPPSSGR